MKPTSGFGTGLRVVAVLAGWSLGLGGGSALPARGGDPPASTAGESSRSVPIFLADFLKAEVGVKVEDLGRLKDGGPVVGLLSAPDKSDLGAYGMVHIEAPVDSVIALIQDLKPVTANPHVVDFGRFSRPPVVADLDSLFLDDGSYEGLKKCREGSCEIKMPAEFIRRFREEIDWKSPDARRQARLLARQLLLGYVQAYLAGGDAALGAYHDKKEPQEIARNFQALLAESPYLTRNAPRVYRFLREYPVGVPADSTVFLYWVKEDAGPKPVMTVNQVSVHRVRLAGEDCVMVASKQIYASHYFRGALEVLFILDDREPGAGGCYALDISRMRIDPPSGLLAGVERSKIEGQAKRTVAEELKRLTVEVAGGGP